MEREPHLYLIQDYSDYGGGYEPPVYSQPDYNGGGFSASPYYDGPGGTHYNPPTYYDTIPQTNASVMREPYYDGGGGYHGPEYYDPQNRIPEIPLTLAGTSGVVLTP